MSQDSNPRSEAVSAPWTDGQFLCWGCGSHGQNCHEGPSDVSFMTSLVEYFTSVNIGSNVKLVACGSSHNVLVTETNDIYVWGNNHCGQLGCGDQDSRKVPTKISLYAVQRENPDVQGVACGGRHTFVWLDNGNVFSFGNNTFAQLAYDSRIKNYRENQKKPHLIRTVSQRQVQQVACGEKHTMFLFRGGRLATVGAGSLGQLGNGERDDSVLPVNVVDMPPIKFIAAGAFHNVVIDVTGELWCWGFGMACGINDGDVLKPERYPTKHPNIVRAACGHSHSAALSANGTVYTWGHGPDGQLGHGAAIHLLSLPTKVSFTQEGKSVHIAEVSCGEKYTAVVSASGQLYLWGKNSHVIDTSSSSSVQYDSPQLVNTDQTPVRRVMCGSWHAAAITGRPDWVKEDDSSDLDGGDSVPGDEETESCDVEITGLTREDTTVLPRPGLSRERTGFSRERTAISLADFYAPSPSPTQHGRSPSPDIMTGRKKLPPYLEPRKRTKHKPPSKKNQVVWKSTAPFKSQLVQLTTIEQSPNRPKKESLDMTVKRLEAASPRYVMPSVELKPRPKHREKTNKTSPSLPRLEEIKVTGVDVVDIKDMAKRSITSSRMSGHSYNTNKSSTKTHRSHKSKADSVKTTQQIKSNTTAVEDSNVQDSITEEQSQYIEGTIPQSNYTRQTSPPKSQQQTLLTNNHKKDTTTTHNLNMTAPKPRVFISGTRFNFLSPEPQTDHHHAMSRSVRQRKRPWKQVPGRKAVSQPVDLNREDTMSIPSGGFRGNGFRNESELSTYSSVNLWSQTTPVHDLSSQQNRHSKMSNAPSIALHRQYAKQRIERSLKHAQNNYFNTTRMPKSQLSSNESQKNIKRSYAVPQRINFMAKDLITRQGTNYGINSFHQNSLVSLDSTIKTYNRKDLTDVRPGDRKRVDATVGLLNTARVN